jgi:hypothetical protein
MATEADIEALVTDWEPKTRDAFIGAVKDTRDQVVLARLEAEIAAGDISRALAEVGLSPERFQALDLALSAAFAAGGAAALALVNRKRTAGAVVVFNLRDYAAEAWLKQNIGALTAAVANDQQAMVEREIVAARASGKGARATIVDLIGKANPVTGRREAGLIGLSSAQVEWVRNYEAELQGVPSKAALTRSLRDPRFDRAVEAAIRTETPLAAETRQAMVNAYRNRALKQRATALAEQEASKAIHQAQVMALQQAVAKGAISVDQIRRFAVHMGDHRVRPTHRMIPGLNPHGVGLNEPFVTVEGPQFNPPFGPGCRCGVRIGIFAKAARLAA